MLCWILILISLLLTGKDYQEDCVEAAVPVMQTCVSACNQGYYPCNPFSNCDFPTMSFQVWQCFLILPMIYTEVQALWDWRRQEGKGNISVLSASLCSFRRKILRCVLFLELIRHCGIILFDLFCSRLCCDEVWSRCGRLIMMLTNICCLMKWTQSFLECVPQKGKLLLLVWKGSSWPRVRQTFQVGLLMRVLTGDPELVPPIRIGGGEEPKNVNKLSNK